MYINVISSNFNSVSKKLSCSKSHKIFQIVHVNTRRRVALYVCRVTVYYTLAKSLFPEARSLGGRFEWRTRLFRSAGSLDLLFAPIMRTDIIYTQSCHSRAHDGWRLPFPSLFTYNAKLLHNVAATPSLQKSIVRRIRPNALVRTGAH